MPLEKGQNDGTRREMPAWVAYKYDYNFQGWSNDDCKYSTPLTVLATIRQSECPHVEAAKAEERCGTL